MIDLNEQVINGTVTGGSITAARELTHNKAYSVQVKWSGSAVTGSAKLQASLNGTDWLDIPDSTQTISGSSGGFMYDVTEANYNWVNVVCTSSSGAITFQAWMQLKRESKIG